MTELQNITLKFGEHTVFSDFSHCFPEGKITAIMGASGCGKTTLLRIIAGLISPESGRVMTDKPISFMFQEPRLCPWLTAAENVNLVMGDKRETLPEAKKWLEAVGLLADAEKYPKELSGGMQQRVTLARTLAFPASLYLFDEPFKGLDRDTRQQIIPLVRKFTAGKTVILVTHDQQDAEDLADEMIHLT